MSRRVGIWRVDAKKYKNKITLCDRRRNHRSKAEAGRCNELHMLAMNGDIRGLVAHPQPRYPMSVGGKLITVYVADFAYQEPLGDLPDHWRDAVEDVKGFRTTDYKLKAKLFEAIYGFKIKETQGGRL